MSQPHVAQYIDHFLTEGFSTPWTETGESIDFLNDVYTRTRASLVEDAVSVFCEPDPTDPSDIDELIADYLYEITGEHRDDIDQLEYASQVVVYLMSADSSRVILNNAMFIQLALAYELARMVDLSHVGLYDFLDAAGFIQSAVLDDNSQSEECEFVDHEASQGDELSDQIPTTHSDVQLLKELESAWEDAVRRHDEARRGVLDLLDDSYGTFPCDECQCDSAEDDTDTGNVSDEEALRDAAVDELANELLGLMEDFGLLGSEKKQTSSPETLDDVVRDILGFVRAMNDQDVNIRVTTLRHP